MRKLAKLSKNGCIVHFNGNREDISHRRSLESSSKANKAAINQVAAPIPARDEPIPPVQSLEPRLRWLHRPVAYENDDDDDDSDGNNSIASMADSSRSHHSMISQLTDSPMDTDTTDQVAKLKTSTELSETTKSLINDWVYRRRLRHRSYGLAFYELTSGDGQAFFMGPDLRRRWSSGNAPSPKFFMRSPRIAKPKLDELRNAKTLKDVKLRYLDRNTESWRNYRDARRRYARPQIKHGTGHFEYTLSNGQNLSLRCPTIEQSKKGWRRASWGGAFTDHIELRRSSQTSGPPAGMENSSQPPGRTSEFLSPWTNFFSGLVDFIGRGWRGVDDTEDDTTTRLGNAIGYCWTYLWTWRKEPNTIDSRLVRMLFYFTLAPLMLLLVSITWFWLPIETGFTEWREEDKKRKKKEVKL